ASGPVHAQGQTASSRTIDFDEAVRIALDQNTTLKRASNQVAGREAQVRREYMDFTPNLNLSTSTNRNFGLVRDQQTFRLVNQTVDQFSVGASTGITLFDGMENFASLQRANLSAQASDLDLERTRQDVVFEVMNGYLNYIESKELIRVREEELESRRQQLRQTEEQVDVGSLPVSDLYQQQAQVAQAEQQLLNAERQAQLDKTGLIQTLQLDPFGEYEFEAPTVGEADLTEESYELDRLLEQAFQRRTDLQAQQFSLRAAEQNVRAARSGYFPSLSVDFGYGSNWSSTLPDQIFDREGNVIEDDISFFDHLDNQKGGRFGFSINIPVFNRLQTRTQVRQAQIDLQNEQYNLQDQRQQVALQVRQAYLDYQNAEKQLEVADTRLRAAERAREAAQERYNLGAVPFVELAQANAEFVSAASEQVRARYNFIFQKKLIDYYLGVLNPQGSLFQ
ncbi:MAG: TolC family protein, partial [Bacteroidetes bacterium]|nr:TolC family protein [Bacteroidota bacterium]